RQEQDCRALAVRHGLEVVQVYTDNDTGASNLSRKPRPQYDAMLQAVRDGEVGVILAYSNSRLTRRLRELEDLIQLHEQTGVLIKTVASGEDDLSTADGRMVARIKASVDSAEAERTGERVRRQVKARIADGIPRHNRYRTFGYNRDWTINEEEAERIRDAFRRHVAGESIQSIVELWKNDGVVVGGGKTLYHSTVDNILKNPLYAGFMVYKGKIEGRTKVPTIIDEALWNASQSHRKAPRSAVQRKSARRRLLGGLVLCGACGFKMVGNNLAYECSKSNGGCGTQSISRKRLEPLVLSVVRQALIVGYSYPAVADYSEEIQSLKDDIEAIREGIKQRTLRVIDISDTLVDLTKQLKELEGQQEQAVVEGTGAAFDDWDSFVNGTTAEQIATVRRHIQGVEVQKATSKAWNPARVTIYTKRGNAVSGTDVKVSTNIST
ncbi:recombinase family protein, partial [Aeromicrobium sp. Leaf272]|uniref:recombinase family protein n=1 Tax=Aeromicrobium sp. Leaf272 TaxID=1736317 RepID=UPI00138F107C